ncbi:MAG: zinc ribbon domain-containing protein [Thermotaleaceae bacterium]
MWDLIKNDPILKTISIFIVGIFAFAFAFSIMFGSGQSGMEHAAGATGYSAATGMGNMIILLAKLLIIILLIAIIITAIKFIKKHVIGNEPVKGIEWLKNKPYMMILIGIGGVILLLISVNLLTPTSPVNEMQHTTSTMTSNNTGFGMTGILIILLRFVAVVSFMGLITGLVMYFKNRYFNNLQGTTPVIEHCLSCGNVLKTNWKCCPNCGAERSNSKPVEITSEELGKN